MMLVPLTAACIAAAATLFQVPEDLLWIILKTEGGRVGACTVNTNHTHDCGPAQVNIETWAPRLAATLGQPASDISTRLRDDGCFNVWAEGYVLHAEITTAGGDMWDAAGRYNSATPSYKLAYQARLLKSYRTLFGRRQG